MDGVKHGFPRDVRVVRLFQAREFEDVLTIAVALEKMGSKSVTLLVSRFHGTAKRWPWGK